MYKSYKGKFKPKNPEKYIGDVNNIIYRSLLERRFMMYCDNNPAIIKYASEEFHIPYISPADNLVHRYFPDFWIKKKNTNGIIEQCIIEIKPYTQTIPPKPRKKTKRFLLESETYLINQAKWDAAKEFCRQNNLKFVILTEKELKPGK